jgi:hypothetical protein
MRSTESGVVLRKMLLERTGKPTLSESEPPKARALQWGKSPISLTGHRMNSRGADRQKLVRANARADEADSGCLLENGSPQRGFAFC